MEAGRALDRLVSEKVMGIPVAMTFGPDHPFIAAGTPGKVVVPRYSTDIRAAWLVVEKIEQISGCYVEIGWCNAAYGPEKHAWCFVAEYGNEGRQIGEAFEDTAPHAICLASLRAVGALE